MTAIEEHVRVLTTHDRVSVDWTTTAECGAVYWAFTEGLADWLAVPESLWAVADVGAAFYFEAIVDAQVARFYGRFAELEPGRRVAVTLVGSSIAGFETDVVVTIAPAEGVTDVRIEHSGLPDGEACAAAAAWWQSAVADLDAVIADSRPRELRLV